MRAKPAKPILLTHAEDHWNNACLQPYSDNWNVYALGYRTAANLMVAHIDATHRDQDTLVYPIIFLYRQYIELRLKHLDRDAAELLDQDHVFKPGHRLMDRWHLLKTKVIEIEKTFGRMGNRDVLNKAEGILCALDEIDPLSDAFRYPVNSKGHHSIDQAVHHINVRHFKEQIDEVATLLEGLDSQISMLADMKSDYERSL